MSSCRWASIVSVILMAIVGVAWMTRYVGSGGVVNGVRMGIL